MDENVLFLDLTGRSEAEARQALDALGQAHSDGAVKVREATLITRDTAGNLDFAESVDHTHATGFAIGGLLGALVGLLGGPAGAMIGLGAGGLLGGGQDVRRATEVTTALETLADEVPPGRTVLAAEVAENGPEAVDRALGPGVVRYAAGSVRRRVDAALALREEPEEAPGPGVHIPRQVRPTPDDNPSDLR